jgi:hypothetical protein
MSFYGSSIQWRFPCAFQIVFCAIVCVFMPFLPESPRYLARVGRFRESTKVLAALRGRAIGDEEIQEEIREIRYVVNEELKNEGSWSEVFKDGGISGFTRVAIGFSANFFQQLSGDYFPRQRVTCRGDPANSVTRCECHVLPRPLHLPELHRLGSL